MASAVLGALARVRAEESFIVLAMCAASFAVTVLAIRLVVSWMAPESQGGRHWPSGRRQGVLPRRLGLVTLSLLVVATPQHPLLPLLAGVAGVLSLALAGHLLLHLLSARPSHRQQGSRWPRRAWSRPRFLPRRPVRHWPHVRFVTLAQQGALLLAAVALLALGGFGGLLALRSGPRASAEGVNPIVNPSFIAGGGGWETFPSTGCGSELGILYDAAESHDAIGTAARLDVGSGACPERHQRATQQFSVPADAQAYLTFWYKGISRLGRIDVELRNVTTNEIVDIGFTNVRADYLSYWKEAKSRLLNLPAGQYRLTFVGEEIHLVDDVALIPLTGPPPQPAALTNAIINPSFEHLNGVGYGWEVYYTTACGGERGVQYSSDSHDGNGGSALLQFSGASCAQHNKRASQRFSLATNNQAELKFWYKGVSRLGRIDYELRNVSTNAVVLAGDVRTDGLTEWREFRSGLLTLPAGEYRLTFVGEEAHLIDDITLDRSYAVLHNGSSCTAWTRHDGDPVNVVFGNYVAQQRDFALDGAGLPIALDRSYNSAGARDVGFGYGWTHPYATAVLPESATTVLVRNADCRLDRFTDAGGGNYTAPPGIYNKLVKNADGTYTLTTPGQAVYGFDTGGRLTAITDRYGNRTTLAYTATGVTVTDAAGRGITLTYGTGADSGRFVALTEVGGAGRTVGYAYSAAGDLVAVTDVRGGVTTMTYDGAHRLLTITDPAGKKQVDNTYDASGRVVAQRDAQGVLTTLTYDTANKRTTRQDAAGTTIATYTYDSGNRVPTVADGGGNSVGNTYDANNNLVCVTDPAGGKTAYGYDARGNVTSIVDPLNTDAACALKAGGVRTTIAYNAANQPTAVTDPLGRTTGYAYDANGYLTTVTDALNQTTTYTYVTIILASGATTTLVETERDALGRVTRYGYDGQGRLTTVTDALGRVTSLEYDAAGRVVKITAPGGLAECREYDAANLLTATVRNCVPGQPATADRNVRTEHGYDAAGRRSWTRGPAGEVSRTIYDDRGLVARAVAGCATGGAPSTAACDAFDPAAPHLNRVTAYGYDDRGRPTTVTDPLGVATRTEYDAASRPFRTTRNSVAGGPSDGATNVATTTEYDAAGRPTATVDPLGRRTVYRYDAAGRRYETIENYADGDPRTGSADSDRIARAEYDAAGNVTATIANYVDGVFDPARPDEDVKTVTVYDALDRPQNVIEVYVDGVAGAGEIETDRITEHRYDAVGNVVAVIDPAGRVTVTAYDALNRPVEVVRNCTDGAGTARTGDCAAGHGAGNDENARETTAYDAAGRVAATTDPLGRRTALRYDGLGRVVERVQNEGGAVAPANVATTYAYDAAGRLTATTDPLGKVWRAEYDAAGWKTREIDPTDRAVRYSYDGLGRPVGRIDALNRERRTVYDPLGRPSRTVVNWQDGVADAADGSDRDLIAATEYDAAGRRVAAVAPDGRRTAFGYDGLDRLTAVTENAGGAVAPADVVTRYGYDRADRLTSVIDAEGRTRGRAYNAAGWQTGATDGLGRVTAFGYDRAGNRTTVSDPRPVTVTYAYDRLDRQTGVSAPGLTPITFAYDVAGRRTAMTDASGSTTYAYDGLDRPTAVGHSATGTVTHGWDAAGRRTSLGTDTGAPTLGYAYDAAGRPLAVTRNGAAYADATYDAAGRRRTLALGDGSSTAYTWDGADRLTGLRTTAGATVRADFAYTLGRGGEVVRVNETVAGAARSVAYTYDGLRRLAGATEVPGNTYGYSYDRAGNRLAVTKDGAVVESRQYDAADQVVGWRYDGAGQLLDDGTQTYAYDPLGRLTGVTAGGATTSYVYDGDGALAQRASGRTTTRYTLDTAGGPVERLGATEGNKDTWYARGFGVELSREAGRTVTWFLPDRLGSVRAAYAGGALAARHDYDPYGVPEGAAPTDYGFAGEPRDGASGLIHLRARWYQPQAGRFLSRDPWAGDAGAPQTLAPYAYAHNDPANGTDPTGRARLLCGAAGGGWRFASAPCIVITPQGPRLVPCPDDEPGEPGWMPPGWDPPNPCPVGGCKTPGGRGVAVVTGAIATAAVLLTPSHTEQDDEPRRYLYHYTDIDGYTAILATRILNPSGTGGRGYAIHGPGQYFTDLPPTGLLSRYDYSMVLFRSPGTQHKVDFWLLIDVTDLALERVSDVYAYSIRPENRAAAAGYGIYLRRGTNPIGVRIENDGPTRFREP